MIAISAVHLVALKKNPIKSSLYKVAEEGNLEETQPLLDSVVIDIDEADQQQPSPIITPTASQVARGETWEDILRSQP